MTSWVVPLRRGSSLRVVGVDVARCLALLGMMATHTLPGEHGLSEVWQGRASALFAVLAGLSLALMSGGRRRHRGRRLAADAAGLVLRALAIAAIGLWLGDVADPDVNVAVILAYYGLLFLLGIPFLALGPAVLLALAGLWCLAGPVLSHLLRGGMPEAGHFVPATDDLGDPGRLLTDLLLTGYYPALTWLAFLLVGMALGRLDLRNLRVGLVVAAVGLVLARVAQRVSALLTSTDGGRSALLGAVGHEPDAPMDLVLDESFYGTTPTDTWWWLAVAEPHSGTPLDFVHTTGSALFVLGVALLATRFGPRVWAVAFGAGAMTLTLYSAHVVMLTPQVWPLEPWFGGTPDPFDYYVTQVGAVLVAGALFALAGLRGPFEWLVAQVSRLGTRGAGSLLPQRPSVTLE